MSVGLCPMTFKALIEYSNRSQLAPCVSRSFVPEQADDHYGPKGALIKAPGVPFVIAYLAVVQAVVPAGAHHRLRIGVPEAYAGSYSDYGANRTRACNQRVAGSSPSGHCMPASLSTERLG
jgi:hypothetical protein